MIYFPKKTLPGLEKKFNYIKLHFKWQYFKLLWAFMKIFNTIKAFLVPENGVNGNQAWRLSKLRSLLHWGMIFVGGVIMAAAFPPLNLTLGAFFAF